MKLSPPKQITFYIAAALGVLGLIGNFVALPVIGASSFWLLAIGFVLLAVANVVEGL